MSDAARSPAGAHNLPRPLTPLVGRDRELAEVAGLLADRRLVTLSGPGGCGKTRLAVAVAGEVSAAFEGGVWWVELTAVSEPAGVARAVATVFGVRERPGRPLLDTLCEGQGPREYLLVLDNCEHLVDACASLVSALLASCPSLRIMVTSREPLGVNGERNWPVLPLTVPDPRNLPPVRSLLRYDAVHLLVDRVAAVEPGFTLTAENAMPVALVCHRLDGIPLAIELVAARARMLAIEEIAARLESSFDLATGGSRGALPQQRTLRATMDWSHALLTAREVVLFRRLSVFRGGFTVAAMETVCGGEDIEPAEMFDLLARLVDKSLVLVAKADGRARYRFLETVRHYACEKLKESGENDELRRRHARYFLRFAEDIEPRINTADREMWLRRQETEIDNLRIALTLSRTEATKDVHVRLAAALVWLWFYRGYLTEGRQWLAGALDLVRGRHDRPTAWALAGAGLLALGQGDNAAARVHLEESVALWRELAEPGGLGQALRFLSASAESEGDHPLARSLIEESVRLFRKQSKGFDLAVSLAKLGNLAVLREDYDVALPALEESVGIARLIGDPWVLALALRLFGIAGLRQGEYGPAADRLTESVALLRDIDDAILRAMSMETLAAVFAALGEHQRAARLFGAVEGLRDRMGLSVIYSGDYERGVADATAGLGKRAFDTAWAQGRAMSVGGATELALEPATSPAAPAELTARESDVLRLVARGMTNEQVAKRLFISPRTVNWHLTAIYTKLGLRSRTEATRFAIDHGLR